jgi:hypothetical protein
MYAPGVVKRLVINLVIAMYKIVIGTEIPSPNVAVRTKSTRNSYT